MNLGGGSNPSLLHQRQGNGGLPLLLLPKLATPTSEYRDPNPVADNSTERGQVIVGNLGGEPPPRPRIHRLHRA